MLATIHFRIFLPSRLISENLQYNIIYNLACYFMWVSNLVSLTKGSTQVEGVWEQRIFGPKWEKMAGGWRKLHNKEFHNLYASLNIIRVLNSKRMMAWAGHVAHMTD
jgi:hypothetical protein